MEKKFYGEYFCSLDEKSRIILPSTFRNQDGEGDSSNIDSGKERWVITRGFEKCLLLYPEGNWEEVIKKFSENLLYKNKEDRLFMRFFIFPAKNIELDKQGRFTIPKPLLNYAGIVKDVVLLGAIQKIEIWSLENWEGLFKYSGDQIESLSKNIRDFDF
ncbi:MAG: division/cell wall cluster transcriptional repressor MraZ [Spirochaetes bacterium]|nr:division/cell wall cluster transcriptional repressor MraZ [Spirochaetota bacterium]